MKLTPESSRGPQVEVGETSPGVLRGKLVDPVCGIEVDPANACRTEHAGTTYCFCSDGCHRAFEAEPSAYVEVV